MSNPFAAPATLRGWRHANSAGLCAGGASHNFGSGGARRIRRRAGFF
jgi:hypothetical protein